MKTLSFYQIISCVVIILITFAKISSAQNHVKNYKVLPQDFHPGSLAFDNAGDVFVASMKQGLVLKFKKGSTVAVPFINRDQLLSTAMGIKVDEKRNILWVCSTNLGINPEAPNAGTYLNAFNLKTGNLIKKYTLPDGGLANDLAIAPDGTIYLTDSKNARILVLENTSSELKTFINDPLFDPAGGFGTDGIVYTDDNSLVVSKFSEGKILKVVNLKSGKPAIQPINFDRPFHNTDALYYEGGNKFLVAEPDLGGADGKVNEITIDGNNGVIREIQTGLNMPVNAVMHEGNIYFVEAQLAPLLIPAKKNDPIQPFAIKLITLN